METKLKPLIMFKNKTDFASLTGRGLFFTPFSTNISSLTGRNLANGVWAKDFSPLPHI
ncbi:MAG: hypothetical protein LBU34_17785 [Planctomycetaceae bacterium]|nr:hypothetical protein [Planctomycetaceae bacterium]